jgi:hypothetical protein
MEDVRISRQVESPSPLRDQRRTAGLVAQYIHELSDRHATTRRDATPPRTPVRESGGA